MKVFVVVTVLLVQKIAPVFMFSSESSEDELREQTIIQSLIEKENEVNTQDDPHHKTEPRSPQYPIEVLKQFESNSMSAEFNNRKSSDMNRDSVTLKVYNETYSKPRDRLFHAWLPVEIIDAVTANKTIVRFQQTMSREYFANFTSSQITLTLLNVQLSPRTYLKMYTHWENNDLQQESIQTLHIEQRKKFHTFDITDFISQNLKSNLTEPHFINIGFKAFRIHGRRGITKINFNSLFDVQVDMPLIMHFYGGFKPAEMYIESSTRRRRSLENRSTLPLAKTRPSTQCQLRRFSVKPEEVGWHDVVQPKILDLGYCSGTCAFPLEDSYYNFSLHSFLMDRYRLHHALSTPNDFPHSTCIPLKYKPISVVERTGPDQMEAGAVHNLAIDICGCR